MEMELEMEMDITEPDEITDEPIQEEAVESDSEPVEEPAVETEDSAEQEEVESEEAEESKDEPVKEPSAKEKAATKIVKDIDDEERYDETNQLKTLIVMQILGNTKTFFDTQSTIIDTDINEYLNKTIEDQYGMLFDLAQEVTMEDMINAQY